MIRFNVHVRPGSKSRRVGGEFDGALSVAVRARAVDGAATAEVLNLVADAFDVKSTAVSLVRGASSRTKLLQIDGDDVTTSRRLDELLASAQGPELHR